jgi:hypothetical protein
MPSRKTSPFLEAVCVCAVLRKQHPPALLPRKTLYLFNPSALAWAADGGVRIFPPPSPPKVCSRVALCLDEICALRRVTGRFRASAFKLKLDPSSDEFCCLWLL